MQLIMLQEIHALDRDAPAARPDVDDEATESPSDQEEADPAIRCAACGHILTRPRHRRSIDGKSDHVFTNPHGYTFRVLCFAEATGVGAVGTPSTEWPWFPDYEWRVATCRGCMAHVGWAFDKGDERFWGLIAAQIDGPI